MIITRHGYIHAIYTDNHIKRLADQESLAKQQPIIKIQSHIPRRIYRELLLEAARQIRQSAAVDYRILERQPIIFIFNFKLRFADHLYLQTYLIEMREWMSLIRMSRLLGVIALYNQYRIVQTHRHTCRIEPHYEIYTVNIFAFDGRLQRFQPYRVTRKSFRRIQQ